jgi:putative phage-type endonuclease
MKTHSLIQGSPEWHAHRAAHWNASDAPAMMGCSPYKSRSQLLHEIATGIQPDISGDTQRLFDEGHRSEALARPIAERIVGEDLYPVSGSAQFGLSRDLAASFDGLTMAEDTVFEHKSLNEQLRVCLPVGVDSPVIGDELPMQYRVQMEQQLLVSGAERVLFVASKWTDAGALVEERHCWYLSDADLRERILAGWAQFEKDVAAYVPPEPEPVAPVGKAPETLPALRVEVTGQVTASNLAEFKATALAAIRGVNRDLKTDQDFADADKAVKWCQDVEQRLAAAKEHALSQTASIDALFKTIDDINAEARAVRLELVKLVDRRKAEIKADVIIKASQAWQKHVDDLNAEIEPLHLALALPDFAGAAKNKRSLSTLKDAVDTELANAKIAADAMARDWRAKLTWYGEEAAEYHFLFADLQALVQKPADDFRLAVTARIDGHKKAEDERKKQEADAARLTAEALQAAAAPKLAAVGIAQVEPLAPQPTVTIAQTSGTATAPWSNVDAGSLETTEDMAQPYRPSDHVIEDAAPTDGPATLKLGTICERLGFTMTAVFVAETLGVQHTSTDKAAKLYTEHQFAQICAALVSHVAAMDELYAGA